MFPTYKQVVSTDSSLRTVRKEQLMEVACRVQAEYGFRISTKEHIPKMKEEHTTASNEYV